MSRLRLRPVYDEEDLRRIYPQPHDHTQWLDHVLRVNLTIEMIRCLSGTVRRAADLSCGDGAILKGVDAAERYFGDYALGYPITGRLEDTIATIPDVDLYICCETIEHLDDPDVVLKSIRSKTQNLTLSTPVDAWHDTNPEHYWAWSRDDVEEMLTAAGFTVVVYTAIDLRPANGDYCFGLWWCR